MTEHHGRDKIKSLLGSHVAPEKTEQLEETKKEIENKLKRILKLVSDEADEGNLNIIESQLVDQVVEYHKQCQSLYEHHDDHAAGLKEKFHCQEGTSSSQYSDSDPSCKEKPSGSIEQQIEAAIDEGKKFFEDLQTRDDRLKDENSTLRDENGALKHELLFVNEGATDLTQELYSAQVENLVLLSKAVEVANIMEQEQRIIQGLPLELTSLQTQQEELEEQFEEQNLLLQLVQTELRDLELERISKEKEDNQRLVSKTVEIDSYIEESKKMKEEIIIRSDTITRLRDEINTTKFNLQLSKNKLRVTEQLLAEKKEVYRKEEEKFQQESKELKEQNSKLSSEIATAQRDLIEIGSSLEKTSNSFSELEVVFQEFQGNDSSFQSRIVEVSEALQIVKNWLMEINGKIEELEKRLKEQEDEVLRLEEKKEVIRCSACVPL